MNKPIYLHVFDRELRTLIGAQFSDKEVCDIVYTGVLASKFCYIGNSNLAESYSDFASAVELVYELEKVGCVKVLTTTISRDEFIEGRRKLYFKVQDRYPMYFEKKEVDHHQALLGATIFLLVILLIVVTANAIIDIPVHAINPNALTSEEADLMEKLHHSFRICEKLKKHIRTLLSHGCMYTISNSNLLFHASCPLNDDGSLKEVEVYPGVRYKGKDLMHNIGMIIRTAFEGPSEDYPLDYARDFFLYLWCGKDSPLFDKSKMATFERYFLKDKETYKEEKGNYFKLRDSEAICDLILDAFGVRGKNRHIINGHVPIHASKGENPIKAGGKLMVIDGGFSEAYHHETGIAGYTLVYHSRGFQLVQHEPFTSQRDAIVRETDIKSTTQIVEMSAHRMLVADTDKGEELKRQVADLKKLLYAYRHGILKERRR